jgi:hypothetical protein
MQDTCQVFDGASKCNRPAVGILKQDTLSAGAEPSKRFRLRCVKNTKSAWRKHGERTRWSASRCPTVSHSIEELNILLGPYTVLLNTTI